MRSALLVHGAGGGGWEWNVWRGVFEAAGLRVRAPDLEPAPAGLVATRLDDYVRQVRAVLETLPGPRVVVGASLGGLIALACAEDADALVLVNPLPPAPWSDRLPVREWPDRVSWRANARLDGTRRALPDADAASALYAMRRWRDESGAVLREAARGVEVAAPTCRCLCIASEADEDVPARCTQAVATAFGATLLRLPESSHVGPLLGRDAASVCAHVLDWLSTG